MSSIDRISRSYRTSIPPDGEAVILGVDGVPDFNVLHSRKHDDEVQPCAFDILTLDGEDLRPLPLSLRKTNLARLLARRPFSCSPGTGALRQDRARERGGRAAAWSTIHADNPTPSPSFMSAHSTKSSPGAEELALLGTC